MFWSLLIQQLVAWPLALWIGLRWSKVSFREACPLTRFPIRIVPALVIASFGITILLLAVASLIPVPEALKNAMAQGKAGSSKLALFLPVVVVAPLAEELFFRGLVLRGYLGRYSVTKAVWASAVLFAVFHLNPWQAVVALPLGLGFAWLFLRTGSLVPAILGHVTANFSTNFLLPPLALALGYDQEALKALGHFPPSMLAIGGAMTGVGGLVLWRQIAKLPNVRSASE
jgi:membrane protease YdiL (CAAX protease family)